MKKIRVAFFGLAHPHVGALLQTVANHPEDFEIVGYVEAPIPTPDQFSYDTWKPGFVKLGVKEYESFDALVAEKPDLAIVNSDNGSREEICCSLLSAGIHVLDEKPMAATYAAAAHMCRVAKENGVLMITNWPVAWHPAFRMAKKLVDEGRIGKLLHMTYRSPATWGPFSFGPNGLYPSEDVMRPSWWYKKETGGGSILDYACYGAMLATWMFGRSAKLVQGVKKNFCVPFSDVEDYSAMMLDFGDGVGLLEGSWSTFNPGEVPSGPVLYGTEGTIVCDRYASCVKIYVGRSHVAVPPTEVIEVGTANQDECLGAHVAKVLRGEEALDDLLAPDLNLAVVAALDAGARSAELGRAVETEFEFQA
ncbi:MAG: Gfo/Idh/MocA family oxidoreductase [Clostridia bacterium]|nr:Gfo/Idh/MocA family oxidoreductase [Clostridia bacterium]